MQIKIITILLRKIRSISTLIDIYKFDPEYVKSRLKNKLNIFFEKILLIPIIPILLPVILIVRLIRPLLLVRVGNLESEGIGHFSEPIEIYLSEIDCGINCDHKRTIDLWYLHKYICNKALLAKWKEHLVILPRFFIKPLHLFNKMVPGGKIHEIPCTRVGHDIFVDVHNVLSKTKQHITFSQKEKNDCLKILLDKGFDPNIKYVCVNVRDSAYHSDLVSDHRNSSINDYEDAIIYLNELGYQVVRLGAKVNSELNFKDSMVFDYAVSGIRSELLDLFLISKCDFHVGTGSGIDSVANLFRKPILYLNISEISLMPRYSYNSTILFQKFTIGEKVLSLNDIFKNNFHKFTSSDQFIKSNIDLIKNSNTEIRDVIFEMHLKNNGKWKIEELDKKNQEFFRLFFVNEKFGKVIQARVGYKFFLTNRSEFFNS
jgi:putative glycosyltransferase (TIGR04372 family)